VITGRLPIDELPIGTVLPSLLERLAHASTVVLQADPGAGKSTVVPLALLDAPWLADRKILLLQPRRLAARSIAQRMAETLGESVGQTVGYRMRLARKTGPKTRIEPSISPLSLRSYVACRSCRRFRKHIKSRLLFKNRLTT